MGLGMVPSHEGEVATPEVALCQSRGWGDLAKLVVGGGKFVCLEKRLSRSKLESKDRCLFGNCRQKPLSRIYSNIQSKTVFLHIQVTKILSLFLHLLP